MAAIWTFAIAAVLCLAGPTFAYAQEALPGEPDGIAVDYGPPPSGGARECELWIDPPLPIRVYFTNITFATGTRHPDGTALYGGQAPGEAVLPLDPEAVPPGAVDVTFRGGWDLSDQTAAFAGTVQCSASAARSSRLAASSRPAPSSPSDPSATADAPATWSLPAAASLAQPASAQTTARLTPGAPLSAAPPSSQLPWTGNADWLLSAGFAALAAGVVLRLRAWLRFPVR